MGNKTPWLIHALLCRQHFEGGYASFLVYAPIYPQMKPSSKVQQALSATLLGMLKSGELSPTDAEWVRQFAARMLADFAVLKAEREEEQPPVAA